MWFYLAAPDGTVPVTRLTVGGSSDDGTPFTLRSPSRGRSRENQADTDGELLACPSWVASLRCWRRPTHTHMDAMEAAMAVVAQWICGALITLVAHGDTEDHDWDGTSGFLRRGRPEVLPSESAPVQSDVLCCTAVVSAFHPPLCVAFLLADVWAIEKEPCILWNRYTTAPQRMPTFVTTRSLHSCMQLSRD